MGVVRNGAIALFGLLALYAVTMTALSGWEAAVEQFASLTDESGTVYTPHWDGSPPGGHHRSGTLRFTPDLPDTGVITLTLKDVAGVVERTFTWEVKVL